MKNNRLIIFLFLSYLYSCNSNVSKNKIVKVKYNDFNTYLNGYREIVNGEVIDLSFKDVKTDDKEISNKMKLFIPNYDGPVLQYGRIKDLKSNFFTVFYCKASSNYMLNLITYDKSGNIITNIEIGEGCGSGFGYSCNEILKIKTNNLFILERKEIIFNQDSLMNGKEIVLEKFNYKVFYNLKNNGKILIDTIKPKP